MTTLDSLQANILLQLLQSDRPLSARTLAVRLAISPRVVRYHLPAMDAWLNEHGVQLMRRRKVGLAIQASVELRQRLTAELQDLHHPLRQPSTAERELLIELELLTSHAAVYLRNLSAWLRVSQTTLVKDLSTIATRFQTYGLELVRRPNTGMKIAGSERVRRRLATQRLLELLPAEWLLQLARGANPTALSGWAESPDMANRAGLLPFLLPLLERLDLPGSYRLARRAEQDLKVAFPDIAKAALVLSLSIQRLRLRQGDLLWQDEPAPQPADLIGLQSVLKALADRLRQESGRPLPLAEIHELGLNLLGAEAQPADQLAVRRPPLVSAELNSLVEEMMAIVASRVDPLLGLNAELRAALLEYLPSALYRVRYHLPFYTPQACEIQNAYPQLFEAAREVCAVLEKAAQAPVPQEEISYVTMCLVAAVEGGVHRAPPRVAVLCPLGVATSRMLVSRLKAEFPTLEIVSVCSFETMHLLPEDLDLIITTSSYLPSQPGASVIQVNPLLYPADRVRILNWLQEYYKTDIRNQG
ncbi:MAG: PRD domain-containing protein [Anaerolineales bacterium]